MRVSGTCTALSCMIHDLVNLMVNDNCVDSIEPDRLGSDHCPVVMSAVVQLEQDNTLKTAALCSKYFTEFAGKQQDIHSYLVQRNHEHQDSASSKEDSRWLLQEALFSQPQPQHPTARRPAKNNPRTRQNSAGSQRSIASFFQQKEPKKSTAVERADSPLNHSSSSLLASQEIPFEFDKFRTGKRKSNAQEWRMVLSGQAKQTPLCHCQLPTVSRTVLKANENWGRKFYVCTKPAVGFSCSWEWRLQLKCLLHRGRKAIQTLVATSSSGQIVRSESRATLETALVDSTN